MKRSSVPLSVVLSRFSFVCLTGEGVVPEQTDEMEASQRGATREGQGDGATQTPYDALRDVIGRPFCRGAEGQDSELFRTSPRTRHWLHGQGGLLGVTIE